MLVLGVDFETTGLDVKTEHITEVGAVLWDTDEKAPKVFFSHFIKESVIVVSEEITKLTGIHQEDLERFGGPAVQVFKYLLSLFSLTDIVVAHNGNLFDRPMLENNLERYGMRTPKLLWVDSSTDVDFPPQITTRRLSHLAADHGFVNPFPHRAMTDVLTMMKVLSNYDWNQIIKYARTPTLTVRANVTFQQKDEAKKRSYRFNPSDKSWTKSIKDFQLEDERKNCPFDVVVIAKGAAQ